MRLFALVLLIAIAGPSSAQNIIPPPEQAPAPVPQEMTPPPPTVVPAPQASSLDQLFEALSHQTREDDAGRTVRQIWSHWTDSGSDTIDLLMDWAAKAIEAKKYAVAEDLLTQITVLAPDYAEGWNRRATLYFVMDDFGRSLSDIERTLQLEPRHFGALSGLGVILARTGADRKALTAWYKVLEIYPANRNAQKAVVELEEELAGRSS